MIVASALLLAAIVNLALAVGWETIGADMLWKSVVGEALSHRVDHAWYLTAKVLCGVDCWHCYDSPPQAKNGMSAKQNPYQRLEQMDICFLELEGPLVPGVRFI